MIKSADTIEIFVVAVPVDPVTSDGTVHLRDSVVLLLSIGGANFVWFSTGKDTWERARCQ